MVANKGPIHRLLLGPIVGHTDYKSARIWIRVHDVLALFAVPTAYTLRIVDHGVFPFKSTEDGTPEFGTAIAQVDGLRPDWAYRYQVLRNGRVIPDAHGTFRTMPLPGSFADMLFVSLSCSNRTEPGAWPLLKEYIDKAQPRFIIMMGDQVYLDDDFEVWVSNLQSSPAQRRKVMAEIYQQHWSREPIRTIMANIPTYMMWDDHDIRNSWGSWAPDSPTLAGLYPRGAPITKQYNLYFEDARDLCWHFQMVRNPLPNMSAPTPGMARAMPFYFQCGRLAVLVVDNRGVRDIWRPKNPILGDAQWTYLSKVVDDLPPNVDAFALVTPLPLASMSPTGKIQWLFGNRTDDVELYKEGKAKALLELQQVGSTSLMDLLPTALGALTQTNTGTYRLDSLSDVRDNWAYLPCRPEQAELIRLAARARLTRQLGSQPRGLVFIGGDLHAGALYDLTIAAPDFSAPCLVTSGIAKETAGQILLIGTLLDEDYEITDGIRAHLQYAVQTYNFGVTHVLFGAGMPVITNVVAHEGVSWSSAIRL